VESTAALYTYAHDNPVNQADPTGREVLTASRFAHRWLREFARINRIAAKHHIDIGLFDDYALTGFYATLYNLTQDPSLQARYQASWQSYYAITVAHVSIALAPLAAGLETADNPWGVIKTLVNVAANVFGI
jgi:hypothetical protein